MLKIYHTLLYLLVIMLVSCGQNKQNDNMKKPIKPKNITAKQILGNPEYQAISYGGYRKKTLEEQPTVAQLKQDLKIMHAMGIRILRTYNVRLPHAANVLKAIKELKEQNTDFEMYVMLGAWIDCKNAWTDLPVNHFEESENNETEIKRAVELTQLYPDIIKIIAVGNEAMVKWATSYFVQPNVILKWVNYLQQEKKEGQLPKDLWITSSDNFASWGGGDSIYHVPDLEKLYHAVDYISIHTYPMHDTHYNPIFWGIKHKEIELDNRSVLDSVMKRSLHYAVSQYNSVYNYMKSLNVDKPIHIGETGWASVSSGYYGHNGSKATDEYKQALYYNKIRKWTNKNKISCFYFEAFDEPWKDPQNKKGSENHFGLFTKDGKAKYALWDSVDNQVFKGLKRGNNTITKTYSGKKSDLFIDVSKPTVKNDIKLNH